MNEREARYSQPKLELYGLYRALRHFRLYIIGVKNLIVEVDAKYIKEMLNHPDLQPNAIINRWIGGILTFTFKLVYVPAKNFKGTDGLSRRWRAEDDSEIEDDDEDDDEDIQDWFSKSSHFLRHTSPILTHPNTFSHSTGWSTFQFFSSRISDNLLDQIFQFLSTLQLPSFPFNHGSKMFHQTIPELFHQGRQIVETTSCKSPTCYSQHQSTQQKSSTHS